MHTTTSPVPIVMTDPNMTAGAHLLNTIATAVIVSSQAQSAPPHGDAPPHWLVAEAWSAALTEAWSRAYDAVPDELRNLL